jgi:glycosyltransferase involved in cell wall biosynthesis
MKILYLHQYFNTPKNMGGSRSYYFARHLVRKGHHVTIITSSQNYMTDTNGQYSSKKMSKVIYENIEIIYLSNPFSYKKNFISRLFGFFYFSIASILAGLKSGKNDLVFATSTPLTIGIPGVFLSRFYRVPFVFEVRDLWPETLVAMGLIKNKMVIRLLESFEHFIYSRASQIVGVTHGICNKLIKNRVDANKVTYIPHSSDIENFDPQNGNGDFRKRFQLENKFILVFSGAHGMANGLDFVLHVAKNLTFDPDYIFLLIGDGKEKASLITKAKKMELANVRFISPIPKSEMGSVLADANLGLMILQDLPLFHQTACPNKLFDYLASGLPVLVNFEGETRALVERNHAGIFVSPQEPSLAAKKIIELKTNPALLKTMSRNARKIATEQFAVDINSRKFEDVLLGKAFAKN